MTTQSQRWPSDRAVLLVHGVGNARPGDYDGLVAQLTTILADQAFRYAIYVFYYDQVNEWFSAKIQAAKACAALAEALRSRLDPTKLGNVIADFVGDVVWPILIADAREAVRAALLAQLQQIVLDGTVAGHQPRNQHLSIIPHSLGCFHTYEALHAAAASTTQGLAPGTDGVQFDNVIFMASPVQLIRTAARDLGPLVPQSDALKSVSAASLSMPTETILTGEVVPSVRRTISITGNLDPVGGYFFRNQGPWAYMALPEQISVIDQQEPLNIADEAGLTAVLQSALQTRTAPNITPENPHDWSKYVARHAADLKTWLAV